jgi:hypothetical protein
MSITKADLKDADVVDSYELSSDGYLSFLSSSVVSTTSGTQTVIINMPSTGEGILYSSDNPVQANDLVWLSGTLGADGYYTVSSILSDTSFTVIEPIGTSTGGSCSFIYRSGALNVGYDVTEQNITSKHNVQDALSDVAITYLLHNEPLKSVYTFSKLSPLNLVTQEIYRDSVTNNLIKTIDYTYSPLNKVLTEIRKVYNSSGTIIQGQCTISYSYDNLNRISTYLTTRDI